MYCIYIKFDLIFGNEILNDRQDHLLYIESKKEKVFFGGVLENERSIKNGILYIVSYNNYKESLTFLSEDPYFKYVKSYEINKFSLKISNNG